MGVDGSSESSDEQRRDAWKSFRSHFVRLAVLSAVPLVLLWISLLAWVTLNQRNQIFQGVSETGRAVQLAVDREIRVTQASMEIFARSHLFEALAGPPDAAVLQVLQETTAEIGADRSDAIHSIVIYSPEGRAIVDSRQGDEPPSADFDAMARPSALDGAPGISPHENEFLALVGKGEPFITDLFYDTRADRYLLAVGVPVVKQDAFLAVVVAKVLPESLTSVLQEQDLAVGTIAAIVDRNGTVVARTRDVERFLGGLASDDLVAFARDAAATSSLLSTVTMDGVPIYASFRKLSTTPYAISFAARRDVVNAPVRNGLIMGGILGLLALAALAGILRRQGLRLDREVVSLAEDAEALGRGEPIPERTETVQELASVREALRAGTHSLAEREERLRLAIEGTGIASWDIHLPSLRLKAGSRFWKMLGTDEPETSEATLESWRGVVREADKPAFDAAVANALEGRDMRLVFRTLRDQDGDACRIEALGRRFRTRSGQSHLIGIAIDVTARMAAEERQRLLMDEVDHRAKNALAVVQALVRLTPRDDPDAFAAAVEGRVRSMANAHDLLASKRWSGASLREIARAELAAPIDEGLVNVRVPEVRLATPAVQPLSMVLHELATNAMKYGALSRCSGRITLEGEIDVAGDLRVSWLERGGPPISSPPATTGFGSFLIRTTVERQLGGSLSYDWQPDGLWCRITVPAPHVTGADEAMSSKRVAATEPQPEAALHGCRVLVVEDEALLAEDMSQTLSQSGCQVLGPATTLSQAEELLRRETRIDVAVIDINIMGASALRIADDLLQRRVPLVFATGYGLLGEEWRTRPGVGGILTKPVSPDDLRAALVRSLRTGGRDTR